MSNNENTQEKLLNNIQNLQENEKKLFDSLEQSISKGAPSDVVNRLVDEINTISSLRMNLYKNLNNMNSSFQKNLSNTSQVLEEQTMAIAIIESELNENKKRVAEMEQTNINKLRMIEINNYYGQRYYERTVLMKTIIAIFIPVLILSFLASRGIIPNALYIGLVILIGFIGSYFLFRIIYSIMTRDNMNYQEYDWSFNKESAPSIDDDENGEDSADDPWEKAKETCKGSECCADGMYYSSEENKCITDGETEEGMENMANSVFSKYANAGVNQKPDVIMNSNVSASMPYNKMNFNAAPTNYVGGLRR